MSLSSSEIAAIAVGSVLFVLVCAVLWYHFWYKNRRKIEDDPVRRRSFAYVPASQLSLV